MRYDRTQSSVEHARHFDSLFSRDSDPWDLRNKLDERRKRETIRRALGNGRRGHGAELGCGNGITTRDLAPCFARLVAIDGSDSAVTLAKREVADLPHVDVRQAPLPYPLDRDKYDAIIVSEVLYYLPVAVLKKTLRIAFEALRTGGLLISTNHIVRFDDAEVSNARLNWLTRSVFGGEVRSFVGAGWRCDVYRKRCPLPIAKDVLRLR